MISKTYVRFSTLKQRAKDFIQMDKQLIRMLGYAETAFLSEIESWCNYNESKRKVQTHFHDGRWWMYLTYEQWADELSISRTTVKRIIKKLRAYKIVDVQQFKNRSGDQTNYYSVNETMLDVMMACWAGYDFPSHIDKKKYGEFKSVYCQIADQIDKGFIQAHEELLRLEAIVIEALNGSGENTPPSGQNDPMSKNAGSRPPSGQNDPMDRVKMTRSYTNTNTNTNYNPSPQNFENSEEKDDYLEDALLGQEVTTASGQQPLPTDEIVNWILRKTSARKLASNKAGENEMLELLSQAKPYDDSGTFSAADLFAKDVVYRQWCETIVNERNAKIKEKSPNAFTSRSDIVNMITRENDFYAYQKKYRSGIELEAVELDDDDDDYVYTLDEDLSLEE